MVKALTSNRSIASSSTVDPPGVMAGESLLSSKKPAQVLVTSSMAALTTGKNGFSPVGKHHLLSSPTPTYMSDVTHPSPYNMNNNSHQSAASTSSIRRVNTDGTPTSQTGTGSIPYAVGAGLLNGSHYFVPDLSEHTSSSSGAMNPPSPYNSKRTTPANDLLQLPASYNTRNNTNSTSVTFNRSNNDNRNNKPPVPRIVTPSNQLLYDEHSRGEGSGYDSTSVSTMGIHSARAESIRARLRYQEKRFARLMKSQLTDHHRKLDPTKLVEISEIKETLMQVEAEKADLEKKLQYLTLCQEEDEEEEANKEVASVEDDEEASAIVVPWSPPTATNKNSSTGTDERHGSDEHERFLRDKLVGIQRGFEEQAAKILSLQNDIQMKDADIDQLNLDISKKLKYIIDLEYDLQSHSIHYTEYAKQQSQLGTGALNEINELIMEESEGNQQQYTMHEDDAFEGSTTSSISFLSPSHNNYPLISFCTNNNKRSIIGGRGLNVQPHRAQKLITKLLADLDHLEEMYKNEKLNAMVATSKLEKENEHLRASINVLESKKKEQHKWGDDNDKKTTTNPLNISIETLQKRIETLEAIRFLYSVDIERLHEELWNVRQEASTSTSKHELEVKRLTLALEAMKVRCRTLETDALANDDTFELSSMAGSEDSSDFGVGIRVLTKERSHNNIQHSGIAYHYSTVEQRIVECYQEISRLESELEIRDAQIVTMKKDINELRLKEIAAGNICTDDDVHNNAKNVFTELDVKIISSIDQKIQQKRSLVYPNAQKQQDLKLYADMTENSGLTADMTEFSTSNNDESDFYRQNLKQSPSATASVNDNLASASHAQLVAYIANLGKQLDHARAELARKDQDLTIEKAKSSCMSANILDKIDELDQQHASTPTEEEDDDDEDQSCKHSELVYENGSWVKLSPKNNKSKKDRKNKPGRIPLRFYM